MLATRVAKLPEGKDWEYEVKWDGYRIEAVKDGKSVRLFSRRGATYTDKFKSVTKAVADILPGEGFGSCCPTTALSTTRSSRTSAPRDLAD